MKRWTSAGAVKAISAAAFVGFASQAIAADVTWDRLVNADKDPNNWVMYHGNFTGWHFSGLDQINTGNVDNLKLAWQHTPGSSKRGIQSFPLAVDGVVYYTSSSGAVWALNGATGAPIWHFQAKIDQERAEGTFYNPYNRGLAIGHGHVYTATTDGRMIALNKMTGEVVWDNEIMSVAKGNKGFTGAPLVVKDMVIVGANGGELSGCCGPIFAVDAMSGEVRWQFDTIGGDQRSRDSWGNDSWKIGGGGGWMTGSYDAKQNTVWWGTANPAPDYDYIGEDWMNAGPRPGLNLYSSSVVVLNADTGELSAYFQEMPHDAWDFDSAVGEFMMMEKGGKRYMVHPNKGGIIFVYNPDSVGGGNELEVTNAYMIGETYNYIKGVTKDGRLVGRRELPEGKHTDVCPAIDGAISWNTGAFNPNLGLMFKVTQEWCFDIEVVNPERPDDYSGQAYFGASWTAVPPKQKADGTPVNAAYGTLQARDPLSGKIKWRVEFKYPVLASILATKGNLVFVPGADGMFSAFDARNGKLLWQHNNGIGHHGGVISYMVGGKQFVAVVTGWGSHVSGNYPGLFGEPFTSMPTDAGTLMVFSL
jgi:PQQ-dependent dehydrogenase (methanol/ethanol family)